MSDETPVVEVMTEVEKNGMRFEWRDPRTLTENGLNPKSHPSDQRNAFADFLDEVGWIGAILFNERTNRILDGHMRHQEALERNVEAVPVLIVDVDEKKEPAIIALFDKIGTMFGINKNKAMALAQIANLQSERLKALMENLSPTPGEDKEESLIDNERVEAPQLETIPPLPEGGLGLVLGERYDYIVLMFKSHIDFIAAQDVFGVKKVICPFHQSAAGRVGIGRVVMADYWIIEYANTLRKLKDAQNRVTDLEVQLAELKKGETQ